MKAVELNSQRVLHNVILLVISRKLVNSVRVVRVRIPDSLEWCDLRMRIRVQYGSTVALLKHTAECFSALPDASKTTLLGKWKYDSYSSSRTLPVRSQAQLTRRDTAATPNNALRTHVLSGVPRLVAESKP